MTNKVSRKLKLFNTRIEESNSLRWLVCAVALFIASLMLIWWRSQTLMLTSLQITARAVNEHLNSLREHSALGDSSADFSQKLPASGFSTPLLNILWRAAAEHGVSILALDFHEYASTSTTIGRLAVNVSLRGSYGPLKQTLADTLNHDGGPVILQRLIWVSAEEGGAMQNVRVTLILPLRSIQKNIALPSRL